ncbi:tRNA pseudouridine synthase A [Rothia kristinae]|uniref:tRNA pseudouridine synthase A n=1 Tax=Rothia kristinae TaxID=37923 RepID=UPI000C261F9D|nr:tRNA pseudouridine synthase A [Rothia kristinae]TDP56600.1 tRNA pseudouridine(38-40) synthase [Kocuria sp. AG109]MCT1356992.1 tRNA pseudouridine synthase A [Rothia kristinae]MCT1392380.1 tRNA pseudouridine synthase A [Rothia kristinae]MCT1505772.1 tRNA pseudouridine synthase A [Rothia kristinae]MCT2038153.1 tRNA pseudouridine synthase A [Rothia kristinae]
MNAASRPQPAPEAPGEHPLGAALPETDPPVRVRLDFAYDGAPFSGWARQPGLTTVQGCLEDALQLVLRHPVHLTVAGRTDAGVHAQHQVAHLDLPRAAWEALPGRRGTAERHAPDDPGAALVRKLNGALTRVLSGIAPAPRPGARPAGLGAILVRSAAAVDPSFDARFSALSRSYVYRIADGPRHQSPLTRGYTAWTPREVDPEQLSAAGRQLLGLHDFLSFCKPRPHATTVRELRSVDFRRAESGLIEARLQADAFCHHMVRAIVGACLAVGEGRRDEAWLRGRLEHPVRDSEIRLAPPEGLCLERIAYPQDAAGWADQAERARARRAAPSEAPGS